MWKTTFKRHSAKAAAAAERARVVFFFPRRLVMGPLRAFFAAFLLLAARPAPVPDDFRLVVFRLVVFFLAIGNCLKHYGRVRFLDCVSESVFYVCLKWVVNGPFERILELIWCHILGRRYLRRPN